MADANWRMFGGLCEAGEVTVDATYDDQSGVITSLLATAPAGVQSVTATLTDHVSASSGAVELVPGDSLTLQQIFARTIPVLVRDPRLAYSFAIQLAL